MNNVLSLSTLVVSRVPT